MVERPARALVVSTTLSTGGAQRVTSTLLRRFDRDKIRPALALLRPDVAYPLPDDVTVHVLGYRGAHTFLATARRLRRLIEATEPDVVLSNVNATSLVTGWALRGAPRRPRWVARIGAHPQENDRGIRKVVARRVYGRADRVVVNSRGLGEAVAAHYPWLVDAIEYVPNPTDFELIDALAQEPPPLQRPTGTPVIVAVGRLFRPKRYDLMLRAFAEVLSACSAELWICGDGPERRALRRLSSRLGIEGSVRWLGFVDNPYTVMRQADLFLMTSENEGLPNALIEAQGLGLPAVSTDCPHGPGEIIEDGGTGLLVPVGDATGIAGATTRLLLDEPWRVEVGRAARSKVRDQFDAVELTAAWERCLLATDKR
jgi:glycosyltransferase involved in cell wall biosynthesis